MFGEVALHDPLEADVLKVHEEGKGHKGRITLDLQTSNSNLRLNTTFKVRSCVVISSKIVEKSQAPILSTHTQTPITTTFLVSDCTMGELLATTIVLRTYPTLSPNIGTVRKGLLKRAAVLSEFILRSSMN